jgi:hypothetical protein
VLSIYEANKENRAHTAPSNAAFDRDLIGRNLEWGVRDLEEVAEVAETNGLSLAERIPMPESNLSLIFQN